MLVEQVTALAGVVDHLYSSLYWFQVSQADLDQHPAKPQLGNDIRGQRTGVLVEARTFPARGRAIHRGGIATEDQGKKTEYIQRSERI
jgi:hypothetical protein